MDLYIDGYTRQFFDINQIKAEIDGADWQNVWAHQISVYNGLCYNYDAEKSEVPLSQLIRDFLAL